jgi:hypothetical protein
MKASGFYRIEGERGSEEDSKMVNLWVGDHTMMRTSLLAHNIIDIAIGRQTHLQLRQIKALSHCTIICRCHNFLQAAHDFVHLALCNDLEHDWAST